MGTGERSADYAGKDLTGKVAFVHNANWHVTWSKVSEAIAQRGARGIITDFFLYPTPPVRTREKVPNAVQLLRLEFNATQQFDFWACSVDYPTGQKIKEWLRLGPVRIHAVIQCRTFAGEGLNILASIAGASLPQESVYGDSYQDVPRRVPDVARMRRILGVQAETPLADGLARPIAAFRTQVAAEQRTTA